MKVTANLSVSAQDFFKVITQSILSDIQQKTNKKMHASQLKPGVNYKKRIPRRFSTNDEVIVKVLCCIENKVYESSYTSAIDITTVRYEITSLEENKICVTYSETYTLKDKQSSVSQNFFMGRMSDRANNRRGMKLLKQIENYILEGGDDPSHHVK